MREVELVPDARNLMESTRSIGYSLPAAVADIIDNSIAAMARAVEVWTPEGEDSFLAILDDGFGMTEQELKGAMRYGCQHVDDRRRQGDLGRFGLGLKMASLSQCRSLTVLSKKEEGDVCGVRWDLDHVGESIRPWPLQILDADDMRSVPWADRLEERSSGTLVVWQKLDTLFLGIEKKGFSSTLTKRMRELKDHLTLVFHRYLDGEAGAPLEILFNADPLKPVDPFLKAVSQRPFPADPYLLGGERIMVEPFILPHPKTMTDEQKRMAGDLQKHQGFYIYRNRRLVIWGTWFRLSRKLNISKLIRVKVDIPASKVVDHMWLLDVKKSSAVIPEELRDALTRVVDKLTVRSGAVWSRRARVERSPDAVWIRRKTAEGTVTYVLNPENAMIRHYLAGNPELSMLLKVIAARLPLDSLYHDLSDDATVDTATEEMEEIRRRLEQMGVDCSFLNTHQENGEKTR